MKLTFLCTGPNAKYFIGGPFNDTFNDKLQTTKRHRKCGVLWEPQIQIEIFVSDSDLDTRDSWIMGVHQKILGWKQ